MVAINSLFTILAACLTTAVLAQTSTDDCVENKPTTEKKVGYFGVVFQDETEQVNAILSNGNDPLDFKLLNGGKPILTSTVGRKNVRDPFILRLQDNAGFIIMATDNSLKNPVGPGDAGLKLASRQMVMWRSKGNSLTEWGPSTLSPSLINRQSGGLSAPEAIWDHKEGKYLVTFSSNMWDADDTNKTAPASPAQIYYSYTTDFSTFSTPQLYNPIKDGGATDLTIQKVTENCYLRFFRNDTAGALRVAGEISHKGLTGPWTAISPIQQYPNPTTPNGGPLVFMDNITPYKAHLWLDDFAAAYQAYESGDFKKGFYPSKAPNFLKNIKQGEVLNLNQEEYDAIKNSAWNK